MIKRMEITDMTSRMKSFEKFVVEYKNSMQEVYIRICTFPHPCFMVIGDDGQYKTLWCNDDDMTFADNFPEDARIYPCNIKTIDVVYD